MAKRRPTRASVGGALLRSFRVISEDSILLVLGAEMEVAKEVICGQKPTIEFVIRAKRTNILSEQTVFNERAMIQCLQIARSPTKYLQLPACVTAGWPVLSQVRLRIPGSS